MNNMVVGFFQLLVITVSCGLMYGCGKNTVDDRAVDASTENKIAMEAIAHSEDNNSIMNKKDLQKTHSLVKPGAAVKLKSTEPIYFTAPGVYEHSLVLVSPSYPGKMTVEVSASEGANIVSPTRHFEFELHADGEYQLPLTLDVSNYGRYYVQLHVTVDTEGSSEARVIAAILQVGDSAVKTQKAAATSAIKENDTIILLPAQETISPR